MKPLIISVTVRSFGTLPLLWNRAIGAVIGRFAVCFRSGHFKSSLANVAKALPQLNKSEQYSLAKHSVIETAKTMMEVISIWRQPGSVLQRYIRGIDNVDLLQMPSPKGLLVLAPHLGNWEFLGVVLTEYVDITIIYQPSDIETMEQFIVSGRCSKGIKLAPANRKGIAMVIEALRAGKCVGILPDQVPNRNSGRVAAKFFDHAAWTMTLVHKVIQHTSCRVVSAFAKRVPGGFYLVFDEVQDSLFSDTEMESVSALNQIVEDCVKVAPEQYQWEYKRYKRFRNCEREQEFDNLEFRLKSQSEMPV